MSGGGSAFNLTYPGVPQLFWSPVGSYQDVLNVIVLGVAIYITRLCLTRLIFMPLTLLGGVQKHSIQEKMNENLWYCMYYPSILVCGYFVMGNESFFPWVKEHYFNVFPNYFDWDRKPILYWFYAFQLAFYVQGFVALVTFETKRKDFIELCFHHLVTIVLILVSYCGSQHRIGLNVMFLHDISDVLLYSTKVFHYLDAFGHPSGKRFWSFMSALAFVAFACVFAFTRNYIFPYFIIFPCVLACKMFPPLNTWFGFNNVMCSGGHCDSFQVMPLNASNFQRSGWLASFFQRFHYLYDPSRTAWFELSHLGACMGGHCFHMGSILVWMMVSLEALHVFWLVMIARMVFKILTKKKHAKQDIRSDDEEQDDQVEEKKRKKIE